MSAEAPNSLLTALRRYAEPLVASVIAVLLARAGVLGLLAGGTLWAVLLLGVAVGAILWALTAYLRLRLAERAGWKRAAGVLSIQEERIAYFGPEFGGIRALDEIEAVALSRGSDGHWTWLLAGRDEPLAIPAGAKGAEALVDALAVLPGFETARALAALSRRAEGSVTVWERRGRAGPHSLSPPEEPQARG
ncbi:MAG: hypothetical protein AAFR79_03670 [Pseudomonadota bacterium]